MRVASIIEGTSVDGPGLRTSIYFAGCTHRCPGCQNPQTWDIESGRETDIAEIAEAVRNAENKGVTFSGGDPMMQAADLAVLAEILKSEGFDLWCYTGYTFEQILRDDTMARVLRFIDVLVDGPYVEAERDTTGLLFRGSRNQRLIDVWQSLAQGKAVLWQADTEPDFGK